MMELSQQESSQNLFRWADLQIPSRLEYGEALERFFIDSKQFVRSLSWLLTLTFRPILRLLFYFIRLIYQHGLAQTHRALVLYWKWQIQRNLGEISIQVGILLLLLALYRERRILQHYTRTIRNRIHYFKLQTSKKYRQTLKVVATTSVFLAVMTPHAIVAATLLFVKLSFPNLFSLLAEKSPLLFFLKFLWPIMMTANLLYEQSIIQTAEKENAKTKNKRTQQPMNGFPKAKTRFDPLRAHTEDGDFWARYWLVFGALEFTKAICFRSLASIFRFTMLHSIGQQLEVCFFIFIYTVPIITPSKIGDLTLPEGRPLHILSDQAISFAHIIREYWSASVSQATWDKYVSSNCETLCRALVFTGMLSTETAEWCTDFVKTSRNLIFPLFTLLLPGPFPGYGVAYVKFLIPMKKTTSMKYWVLLCFTSGIVGFFAGILAWIPFSNHALFMLYCWLNIETTTHRLYAKLQSDLQFFRILPGEVHSSHTGQLVEAILQRLPNGNTLDAQPHQ